MTRTRIVEVTWTDAVCEHSEVTDTEFPVMPTVRSYGLLVARTPKGVIIAAEKLTNPQTGAVTYRATSAIPAEFRPRVRTVGHIDD